MYSMPLSEQQNSVIYRKFMVLPFPIRIINCSFGMHLFQVPTVYSINTKQLNVTPFLYCIVDQFLLLI